MANNGGGGGLSGLAISRPVFTTMLMALLVVLGIFSFRRLPVDQFPSVDLPFITVQTIYPGASAEVIEREVTRRMEEAFNPVEGVDRIMSVTLEGVSQVMIEFDLGRDVDQAAQDIRTKIDGIRRDLPADIEPPLVAKFDPAAEPIISIAFSSNTMPIPELTVFVDEVVRRRLESAQGVGEARMSGGLEREVRVFLQPDRMQAVGVTVPDIMQALQTQNMEVPAGRLERGASEQLVRVTGRINEAQEFGDVFIASRDGRAIRLKDVARVEEGTEEERSLALVNERRAVALDLLKVSGANTVAVAEAVKEELHRMEADLPRGVEVQIVRDNSVMIEHSVADVIKELLIGALLTVIVVMLFLNDWKATAITSMALPVSVISAFILLNALGFSINVITLMALSLSIGILIDDAIVVIENIVRHREAGEDHFTAARNGTQEIVLAVMATTFSIVAVFVPVAFMGGIIGRFFYQFGLTVAWAVLVSLFVSFTLTPMLAAWWGVEPHQGIGWAPLTRLIGRFNTWFDKQANKYRGVVGWALKRRKTTLAIATAALVAAFMLFPFIGGGFMPDSDDSEFAVTFETPEGSSLTYTRAKADQIQRTLNNIEGVDYTYTTIGAGATGTVNNGNIYVKLTSPKERDRSQQELMVVAREDLARVFGARTSVLSSGGFGGPVAPLQIEVRGPDMTELQRIANLVVKDMESIPGVVDVNSSLGDPRPELRLDINRDLANDIGLDVGQIAATVRPFMAGQTATRWEDPTGEEREVVVQIDPSQRQSPEDLAKLPIATSERDDFGAALTVPLGEVATIQRGTAPSQIDRQSLERVATVGASVSPELSIAEASSLIQDKLDALEPKLPAGYSTRMGGETEQLQETMGYVVETILLAVILIFLILASQFESFTQPFAIMMTLPLSLVGVLLALLLTNDTLNMMSMIGLIMLMGLVTKNAILLVDNANERRLKGIDRRTALIEAGAVRLRPIIMTTAAMIFGMLPIALALGEGGGFRAPMARAVIGGLITSTMLTLVVVPVVYTYMDDMAGWVKRKLISEEHARELHEEQHKSGLERHAAVGD
ncbi:MAG TPA: efflux RND transporter permease subunit [Longimicrobiales bacterium]|nr:efflux RND transporter permease subunit [Longimicrobiales bacterium]